MNIDIHKQLKYLLILGYLSFFITHFSFSASNTGDLNRTIAIMPVYYLNSEKEYKYLSTIIQDVIKSKLLMVEKFSFTNFNEIDKKIAELKLSGDDLIDQDTIIKLSLSLGSDVVLTTKYAVSKGKIIIISEVIDILSGKTIVTSSVHGNLDIDIFSNIDTLALDIAGKTSTVLNRISEEKLTESLIKIYGEDKYRIFTRQKDLVSRERELVSNYFGIHLGTSYADFMEIIQTSQYKYKKKGPQVIVYGSLSRNKNIDYSVFYFLNNTLVDCAVVIGYPIQISEEKYSAYSNELTQILGEENNKIKNDTLIWNLNENRVEFSSILGAKGYLLFYLNYSTKDEPVPIDLLIPRLLIDANLFNKAMEIGVGGMINYSPLNSSLLFTDGAHLHTSFYQTFRFAASFNFCYYPGVKYGLGFEISSGYNLNMIVYPYRFAASHGGDYLYNESFPLFHDIENEIRFIQKFGKPMSMYKLLLGIGGFFSMRFITTAVAYSDRYNLAFTIDNTSTIAGTDYTNQISIPNYYSIAGPSLFLGFEKRNKQRNMNITFGGVFKVAFNQFTVNEYGFIPEYYWSTYKWVETKPDKEAYRGSYDVFLAAVITGLELKISFNYFKVLL